MHLVGALRHVLFFLQGQQFVEIDAVEGLEVFDLFMEVFVVSGDEVAVGSQVEEGVVGLFGLVDEQVDKGLNLSLLHVEVRLQLNNFSHVFFF